MDGEAGWWTTCGNIGLPPLARVMGVGRQQQQYREEEGGTNQLGEDSTGWQTTPRPFHQRIGSFRLRPFVSRPLQCFNCQKFGHQARTCRSEAQTCRYCAGRHESAQCKDSESRTLKCVNCGQGHAATSRLCPKMLEAESKAKSSHKVSATKQVNRIPAPIPLKNAWTVLAVQEVGKEPSTQQVTTIRDPMEVSTKSQQSVRKSKPHQTRKPVKVVAAPQPATKCLDKTTSAVDDGVSGSDVSKPVPPRTIGQARPTNRQATSDAPRERGTNRRCTGDHTDSTHRCNIPVKEDFCREHSSSTSTQEDNGGSHGCNQHPHPVEDKVIYNGPFQGHRGFSHTVCPTSNGPFQGHQGSSHTLCSTNNGPFQGHCGSHTVYVKKGPFQDQSCSRSDNGPFQGHGGSRSDNGPFQGHGGSRPDNGPFQGHRGSHTVCVKKVLFRTRVVHVPITALFRATVVHSPYVQVTALFRATVVHSPYVQITALFRATVVHSP